ncbi:unnamed protein product, partial [Amoebophrya sp. A25]
NSLWSASTAQKNNGNRSMSVPRTVGKGASQSSKTGSWNSQNKSGIADTTTSSSSNNMNSNMM